MGTFFDTIIDVDNWYYAFAYKPDFPTMVLTLLYIYYSYRNSAAADMDATSGKSRTLRACGPMSNWKLRQTWSQLVCTDCVAVHSNTTWTPSLHVWRAPNTWRKHASAHLGKPGLHSTDILPHQFCFHKPLLRQLLWHQPRIVVQFGDFSGLNELGLSRHHGWQFIPHKTGGSKHISQTNSNAEEG